MNPRVLVLIRLCHPNPFFSPSRGGPRSHGMCTSLPVLRSEPAGLGLPGVHVPDSVTHPLSFVRWPPGHVSPLLFFFRGPNPLRPCNSNFALEV